MALPSWAADSVVIIRPKTTTSRGSIIFDWTDPTETTVNGCSVQPASTSLSEDGRVLGISDGWTAYLPPGTDVKEGDRVKFNSETYTIKGAPRVWNSPTGAVSAILLNLQRWSG